MKLRKPSTVLSGLQFVVSIISKQQMEHLDRENQKMPSFQIGELLRNHQLNPIASATFFKVRIIVPECHLLSPRKPSSTCILVSWMRIFHYFQQKSFFLLRVCPLNTWNFLRFRFHSGYLSLPVKKNNKCRQSPNNSMLH